MKKCLNGKFIETKKVLFLKLFFAQISGQILLPFIDFSPSFLLIVYVCDCLNISNEYKKNREREKIKRHSLLIFFSRFKRKCKQRVYENTEKEIEKKTTDFR